ncbi:MAG: TAXI family TRAP transporter solute-binding subunit [Deltaproteobacteria bacterium]|nr:TAXI family TRAP transporter solute-binding subunit [Deltaproteobacteria bacterium]
MGKKGITFGIVMIALVCLVLLPGVQHATAQMYLTMGGAGSGGRWYAETSYLAKLITKKYPDIRATGVVSPGVSRGNINRVAKKEIQGGRVFLDDLLLIANRQEPFKAERFQDVRGWMTLNNLYLRCVADMDIKTFKDLKGKKVGTGVRGSGDEALAKNFLRFMGLDPEKDLKMQYLGREAAQRAFANRQLNAFILTYSRNNQRHFGPVFAARPVTKAAHYLDAPKSVLEAFCKKYPVYFVDELGEPVFKHPKLKGIANPTALIIHASVPEDVVYKVTKLIIEEWDTIMKDMPWLNAPNEASLEKLPKFWPIPIHTGAVKAYKEKGIIK